MTAPAFDFGWDEANGSQPLPAGAEPEPTHDTETKAAASNMTNCEFSGRRNIMSMAFVVN
jgi:hypothetical protein